MSQSTQTKMLKAIEEAAKHYGFEVVDDHIYGNTGTIAIEAIDSFAPVLRFDYQFNTGTFNFDDIRPHLDNIGVIDKIDRQSIRVYQVEKFGNTATADEVIKAIRNHLAAIKLAEEQKELA